MRKQRYILGLAFFSVGLVSGCSSQGSESAPVVAPEASEAASEELGVTIDTGKVISLTAESLQSALMEGIRARDVNQVSWALTKGAKPNLRDQNGFTPLVNALAHYNIDVIDALIQKGAVLDLDSRLKDSANAVRTAVNQQDQLLFDAIHRGDLEGVKAAIEDGAAINAVDNAGFTALVNAIVHGQKPIIKHLVELGGSIVP